MKFPVYQKEDILLRKEEEMKISHSTVTVRKTSELNIRIKRIIMKLKHNLLNLEIQLKMLSDRLESQIKRTQLLRKDKNMRLIHLLRNLNRISNPIMPRKKRVLILMKCSENMGLRKIHQRKSRQKHRKKERLFNWLMCVKTKKSLKNNLVTQNLKKTL